MARVSKRKYLSSLLERTRRIQAAHPAPQTFEVFIAWIEKRREAGRRKPRA